MAETPGAAPDGGSTRAGLKAAAAGHSAGHSAAGAHASANHDDGSPLGPVDAQAWGAGIVGVGAGLLVALVLYLVSYH